MAEAMRLDVGCGDKPTGNVNCDLYVNHSPHLGDPRKIINPKLTQNFVRCDAHKLPFKSSSFDLVYSSHLVEHLKHPTKALFEMLRVSKEKVLIVVPHRFAATRNPVHLHFFSEQSIDEWFKKLKIRRYKISVEHHLFIRRCLQSVDDRLKKLKIRRNKICVSHRHFLHRCLRFFPHRCLRLLCFPWEIKIKILKDMEKCESYS